MTAALPPEAAGKPVEVWFTDEARVGQQGTLTRVWAKRGSRPRAPRDRRYEWAYLFGAICPERSIGAAIIMPEVNIEAMNEHLAEISRCVSVGAIALLVLDGAGWHSSPRLGVPDNIVLLPLPPYAPELNPIENIWEFLRGNFLSHRVWDGYEAILDACCDAWNKLMQMPERIASITRRTLGKTGHRIGRLVSDDPFHAFPARAPAGLVLSDRALSCSPDARAEYGRNPQAAFARSRLRDPSQDDAVADETALRKRPGERSWPQPAAAQDCLEALHAD